MRITKRKLLIVFALLTTTAWLGSSGVAVWITTRRHYPIEAEPTPNVPWATLELHRLDTSDGETIGAWLARGKASRPCVLLLHGLDGTRVEMLPVMEALAEEEITSMAITLRVHGDSTGDMLDFGYSSRLDVVAAVELLEAEFPGRPIIIIGSSMGAATALFAAEELGNRVDGYLLESCYKDLGSEMWRVLQEQLPPVVDAIAYAGFWISGHAVLPVSPSRISPRYHARHVPQEVPVVVISGAKDAQLSPEEARAVFEPVKSHGRFVLFEDAQHADLFDSDRGRYLAILLELVAK